MDLQQPNSLALMRKHFFIVFLQISCAAGFAESLPLERMGSPFRCVNLEVHWNVPTNALPPNIWIYHCTPTKFPSTAISNLMAECSFTDKNKVEDNTNEVVFKTADNSRRLSISFAEGRIDYEAATHYGPTNLTKGVPEMSQMPELTTNFLKKIGINFSEIEKNEKGEPNFNFSEPFTLYFVNQTSITNVEWRAVRFRRTLDDAAFVGSNCEIDFGEYGRVSKISFLWQGVERYENCQVADTAKIISWIRNGKAVQGRIPWDSSGINWSTTKSMTIEKVKVCYQSTQKFVYPLLALWTTLDTGSGNVDVEIDCPIIDEAQP
jgi:hypothetical protein